MTAPFCAHRVPVAFFIGPRAAGRIQGFLSGTIRAVEVDDAVEIPPSGSILSGVGRFPAGEELESVKVGRDLFPLAAIGRVLLAQLGVGLALVAIGAAVSGLVAAYSALLGCLVCVVPNAFLGVRIVLGGNQGDAKALLRASYIGAAGKLLMTAAFFAVVFVLVRPLGPGWFFGGFMASQAVIWIAPVLTRGGDMVVGDGIAVHQAPDLRAKS